MDALNAYHWPGNVRELKSAFEYAFVTCKEKMIKPEHLPPSVFYDSKKEKAKSKSFVKAGESLDEIKKNRLLAALDQADGNRKETARILGISRTSVWNQIKRYNIVLPASDKKKEKQ